ERNGPGGGDRSDPDLLPSSGDVLAAAQVRRIRSRRDVDVLLPDRPLPGHGYDRAAGFSKPAVVSNRTFVPRLFGDHETPGTCRQTFGRGGESTDRCALDTRHFGARLRCLAAPDPLEYRR